MASSEPMGELHREYSSPGATPTPWSEASRHVQAAEVYWLSTVRPDGRPHVTPMVAVFMDGSLYFNTGPAERKAKNLSSNPHCIITTGCNALSEGLDLVVEGDAVRVTDKSNLQRVVDAYAAKYQSPFRFTVRDSSVYGEGGEAAVFRVTPTKAFGYGRGGEFSATRWRF